MLNCTLRRLLALTALLATIPMSFAGAAETLRPEATLGNDRRHADVETTLKAPGEAALTEAEKANLERRLQAWRAAGQITDHAIEEPIRALLQQHAQLTLEHLVQLAVVETGGALLDFPRQAGQTVARQLIFAYRVHDPVTNALTIYVTKTFYDQHLSTYPLLLAEVVDHEYAEQFVRLSHTDAAARAWAFAPSADALPPFYQFYLDRLAAEGDLDTLRAFTADHPHDRAQRFYQYAQQLVQKIVTPTQPGEPTGPTTALLVTGSALRTPVISSSTIMMVAPGPSSSIMVTGVVLRSDGAFYVRITKATNDQPMFMGIPFVDEEGHPVILADFDAPCFAMGDRVVIAGRLDERVTSLGESLFPWSQLFVQATPTAPLRMVRTAMDAQHRVDLRGVRNLLGRIDGIVIAIARLTNGRDVLLWQPDPSGPWQVISVNPIVLQTTLMFADDGITLLSEDARGRTQEVVLPPLVSGSGALRSQAVAGHQLTGAMASPLGNATAIWSLLAGGEAAARRLVTLTDNEDVRFQDAARPALWLVDLQQLVQDPLLSLELDAMRRRSYFAKQGGAVQLVILDATADSTRAVAEHAKAVFAALQQEHGGAIDLRWDAIVSAGIAGAQTSAVALGAALQAIQPTAPLETFVMLGPTMEMPRTFARDFLGAWDAVPPNARVTAIPPVTRSPPSADDAAEGAVLLTLPSTGLRDALALSAAATSVENVTTLAARHHFTSIRPPAPVPDEPLLFIPVPHPVTVTSAQEQELGAFQQRILGIGG